MGDCSGQLRFEVTENSIWCGGSTMPTGRINNPLKTALNRDGTKNRG
jgi:hypothetical protein